MRDTHADADADADREADTDTDREADPDPDADVTAHAFPDTRRDPFAYTVSITHTHPDAHGHTYVHAHEDAGTSHGHAISDPASPAPDAHADTSASSSASPPTDATSGAADPAADGRGASAWGRVPSRLMRICPTCHGTGEVLGPLSPRQADVLVTYARCGDQRTTAERLGMSVQTVKNHLNTAYLRLGVNSMIEAIYVLWLKEHFGDA